MRRARRGRSPAGWDACNRNRAPQSSRHLPRSAQLAPHLAGLLAPAVVSPGGRGSSAGGRAAGLPLKRRAAAGGAVETAASRRRSAHDGRASSGRGLGRCCRHRLCDAARVAAAAVGTAPLAAVCCRCRVLFCCRGGRRRRQRCQRLGRRPRLHIGRLVVDVAGTGLQRSRQAAAVKLQPGLDWFGSETVSHGQKVRAQPQAQHASNGLRRACAGATPSRSKAWWLKQQRRTAGCISRQSKAAPLRRDVQQAVRLVCGARCPLRSHQAQSSAGRQLSRLSRQPRRSGRLAAGAGLWQALTCCISAHKSGPILLFLALTVLLLIFLLDGGRRRQRRRRGARLRARGEHVRKVVQPLADPGVWLAARQGRRGG